MIKTIARTTLTPLIMAYIGVFLAIFMALGAMSFSSLVSTVSGEVATASIDSVGDTLQVVRADTSPVTAEMVDFQSVGNISVDFLITPAMSPNASFSSIGSATNFENTVAVGIDECCPNPARFSNIYFSPEPTVDWNAFSKRTTFRHNGLLFGSGLWGNPIIHG